MPLNHFIIFHWKHFFCWLALLLSNTFAQSDWEYGEDWGRTFPECNGNRQSPIALEQRNSRKLNLNRNSNVQFLDYDKTADANFTNTGHTVDLVFNYEGSSRPRTVVTQNNATSTYMFRSLHFHWPSEHFIDGFRHPLEMHMVHMNPDDQKILVHGYLFNLCRRSSSGMGVIASTVRRLRKYEDSINLSHFSPGRVMPPEREVCDYFMYSGSLTTPPCTQDVTWLVHQEPLCVEHWQLRSFSMVDNEEGFPMAGNARNLQRINGRTVQYITSGRCQQ